MKKICTELLIGLLILMLPTISFSQTTSKKPTKSTPSSSNVLDFEADVIEGERMAPSILIQMDLQSPNLDTLVFQRKNFNDFHLIDMRRRPKFRGSKGL